MEGGHKDSQPQPTTGKQKEENRQGSTPHAGRTKEGKREGGRKSTQEPNPGTQKSKQRKAQQATKQKHSSEKIEARQHREGTNTLLRSGKKGVGWVGKEGRGEEQDRTRREGGVPGYANRIHEPTGKEEERCTQLYTRIQDRTNRLYGLFPSCDVFLSVTFTSNRNSHISAWSHIPTGNKSRQTSGYCSTPRYTGMAGSNSMHATERIDGTHKSVRLCPTHADDRVNKYSEKELCNDEVVVALRIPKDSS